MSKRESGADLIAIISSMNRSEKRYFSMNAKQWGHSDGAVMQLYQYLLVAGTWDESKIRMKFEGATFLRQLNVTRTRLQSSLLEALRNYDNCRTYQLEFSKRLDEIDVLYRRKLTAPCIRLAQNALRRANALDLPQQELLVLQWMLRLERQKGDAYVTKRSLELHAQLAVASERLQQETYLLKIHDDMLALLPMQSKTQQERMAASKAMLKTPILQLPASNFSFDAQILHQYTFIYFAFIHSDFAAYFLHYQGLIAIWEGNPLRMRMEEERCFKTYIGFAEGAMMASAYTFIPKTIAKLRRILAYSSVLRPMEKARILSLDLAYRCKTGHFAECLPILPEVRDCIQAYQQRISPMVLLNLLSNSLIVAFISKEWDLTAQFAEGLKNATDQQPSQQLRLLIRTASWVRFYELKKHDALEKSLKLAQKKSNKVESNAIEEGFWALLNSTSEENERSQFQSLHDIVTAKADLSKMPHLELLQSWTLSNLTGKSMLEISSTV